MSIPLSELARAQADRLYLLAKDIGSCNPHDQLATKVLLEQWTEEAETVSDALEFSNEPHVASTLRRRLRSFSEAIDLLNDPTPIKLSLFVKAEEAIQIYLLRLAEWWSVQGRPSRDPSDNATECHDEPGDEEGDTSQPGSELIPLVQLCDHASRRDAILKGTNGRRPSIRPDNVAKRLRTMGAEVHTVGRRLWISHEVARMHLPNTYKAWAGKNQGE